MNNIDSYNVFLVIPVNIPMQLVLWSRLTYDFNNLPFKIYLHFIFYLLFQCHGQQTRLNTIESYIEHYSLRHATELLFCNKDFILSKSKHLIFQKGVCVFFPICGDSYWFAMCSRVICLKLQTTWPKSCMCKLFAHSCNCLFSTLNYLNYASFLLVLLLFILYTV